MCDNFSKNVLCILNRDQQKAGPSGTIFFFLRIELREKSRYVLINLFKHYFLGFEILLQVPFNTGKVILFVSMVWFSRCSNMRFNRTQLIR